MEGYIVNEKGNTEKNKKVKAGACIFPFKYKGQVYNECLVTPNGKVCATEINTKNGIMTKYGYCLPTSPKKGTVKKAHRSYKTLKAKTPSPPARDKTPKAKTPSPVKKKRTIKIRIKKTDIKSLTQVNTSMPYVEQKRWNEDFIKILGELADIMQRQGEPFKARAYQKAQETVMTYDGDISNLAQIIDLPGIGKTISSKLDEYMKTGTLRILEREHTNPVNLLTKVYGIGPKKADELVKAGMATIADLRAHPELLNEVQRTGLNYFEAIETRIPRREIDQYKEVLSTIFEETTPAGSHMEIVGSYRRGAQNSGDIDIIITNKEDNKSTMKTFMDRLIRDKIVIEVLSRGKTKSLTIAQLAEGQTPRRVDFLYAPPSEYAFAILYFTGSKIFNTVQRQWALKHGYSLNEHGLMEKGEKVKGDFPTEKSIFDFLGMEYKEPSERIDGRAVQKRQTPSPSKPKTPSPSNPKTPSPNPSPRPSPLTSLKKPVIKRTLKIKKPVKTMTKLLVAFQTQGAAALHKLSEDDLSQLLRLANNAYYCNQQPIMTDNEYDVLREYTLEKFPANQAAQEGHTQCTLPPAAAGEKNKVTLPYEMWSMDKIKPDTEALVKWQQTYKGPYVLSCKLDGVSGLYSTEGSVPKLYTRGNGKVGQDISHFIPYLNLPQEKNITVRGEFIIKKAVFKANYANDFANSRNFVAGVINQKKPDHIKAGDLSFVAYEVLKPALKPSEQLAFLTQLTSATSAKSVKSAFSVVEHIITPTISNQILSDMLLKWRAEYAYEIDGIICINDTIYPRQTGNPAHAFAFKMVLSDQIAEAKVIEVIWTASKDGYLKPRVHLEPVQLGGVKIEYATGFNAKFIEENRIGVGALVRLVRSGDVIPHIIAVIQPATTAQMPTVAYEWNSTHVDIILQNKADDITVKEKNITLFFSSLEVDGLGAGNVKKIMAAGFDTIPRILKMTEADFMKVTGFKQKMATKIKESIEEKTTKATLPELMHASNIFGRGFGTKKFQLILLNEPTILTSYDGAVKRVAAIEGMAKKTAEQFVNQIPAFLTFLNETNLQDKLEQEQEQEQSHTLTDVSHPLYGKQYVMTGFRDKVLMEKLAAVGAEQGNGIRKNTFVVIVKNTGDENSKTAESRATGIPVMSLDEFQSKYNI